MRDHLYSDHVAQPLVFSNQAAMALRGRQWSAALYEHLGKFAYRLLPQLPLRFMRALLAARFDVSRYSLATAASRLLAQYRRSPRRLVRKRLDTAFRT